MIIFERKYERAKKLMQERNAQMNGQGKDDVEVSDLVEKGDVFAMIVSALITILPVALIVLAVLAAAGYFFLVR